MDTLLVVCLSPSSTRTDDLSVGLILFGLIADLGGVPPNHEYIGGRYWREEPFNDTFLDLKPVSLARFLGFWAVLTKVRDELLS